MTTGQSPIPSLVAKAEALLKEITPGEWRSVATSHPAAVKARSEVVSVYGPDVLIYSMPRNYVCLQETWDRQKRDAAFIAAAPQLVRDLLAQHARDQQEIEQVKKELETRVDHSQYGEPLASASANEPQSLSPVGESDPLLREMQHPPRLDCQAEGSHLCVPLPTPTDEPCECLPWGPCFGCELRMRAKQEDASGVFVERDVIVEARKDIEFAGAVRALMETWQRRYDEAYRRHMTAWRDETAGAERDVYRLILDELESEDARIAEAHETAEAES